MANQTDMTAVCACSFGAAPCPLVVESQSTVFACNLLAATIMDNQFITFGMCGAPSNPAVTAATAAALGVFTPAPCVPAIVAPWAPGSPAVLIENQPALNNTSKLMSLYTGVIQVTNPIAMTVMIP